MSSLKENRELYSYLDQNYSTTHYRFEKIFGHRFPYRKLDLDGIKELKIAGVQDLSGIEELKGLEKINVNGTSDLSPLEKCPNLTSAKINLPEKEIDVESLKRISSLEKMQQAEFYGRGVKSISSSQAMQFNSSSKISYDGLAQLTPEQFSKVQSRLDEVQSLIKPGMSDVEKVETIYRNLIPQDFKYDYSNMSNETNGYLINNTMYGPLVENKGVCSGISSALEVALKNAGLDAVSCGGWASTEPSAGKSHQWNQVKIDGEWYNLDLTNDYDKKSWKYFMKSDNDHDWAEFHCPNKDDKYETIHDCTSTKYDEVYKESTRETAIKELKEQKEELLRLKTQTPLSEINDPSYVEYRNKVNNILEHKTEDDYLKSEFTMYKNEEGQERCYHSIQSAKDDKTIQTLISNDFEYSEKFQKGMLEPSIVDFSKRSPVCYTTINAMKENSTQNVATSNQPANISISADNKSMMQVNNVDISFANQVKEQVPLIEPTIYMQQQAQMAPQQVAQAVGPALTMGGGMGFANTLIISIFSAIAIGALIILGIIILS